MCGIFGIGASKGLVLPKRELNGLIHSLFTYSESRGSESSGLHVYLPNSNSNWTLKENVAASQFLKLPIFDEALERLFQAIYANSFQMITQPFVLLGHSRLVTNGAADNSNNNQPVRVGKTTVIHNGIIVNVDSLWAEHEHLARTADVDTEIIAALLESSPPEVKPAELATNIYAKLVGSASLAWVKEGAAELVLTTNTGDLYYATGGDQRCTVFASEQFILNKSLQKLQRSQIFADSELNIHGLSARSGLCIGLDLINQTSKFDLYQDKPKPIKSNYGNYSINNTCRLLRYNETSLKSLTRCTRCILPETFPYICFNEDGVCNYCLNYVPYYADRDSTHHGKEFIDSLDSYRRSGKQSDVIVPFSGGRDSSYGLHLLCKEYEFKPITFTYDWGMVTDLARRNIARMCGELGIQNILVSADIQKKRENIRKNVIAWLKKPALGMVPLFMAGDKAFFSLVNTIKHQTGIKLNLWCANPLENTDFKTGFCGVAPDFAKSRLDYLSSARKLKLIYYYLANFTKNPSYINGSLLDTAKAYISYYLTPREDFYFLFNHISWDEVSVNNTLLQDYGWEISPDSPSTWRIGDGTAPFYNYIYCTAHGFTEFDTFRSNQIREGLITREEALSAVLRENQPREASLRWYLDALQLDFNSVIPIINALDIRYLHQ